MDWKRSPTGPRERHPGQAAGHGGRIRHGREPRRKRTDGVAKRNPGFFDRVYALVSLIPYGKVATYGQIARLLGVPRAARTVGWAMHGNPTGSECPATASSREADL